MVLLIQYTLLFASVLLLVALGGCFSEHSGVINLGLEGIMVMGALGGALMMRYLPDGTPAALMVLLVILTSIIAGMLYSCLLAISAIHCNADQTIVGTAMNILGTAAATVIVKAINTAANPDDVSSTIQYVSAKKAFLVNIGSFEFNWFMLVAVIALVLSYITLYKTKFGLRLMACGEHPQAADSVGRNVFKMRWAGVLISGLLGGLGGIVYITCGVSEWKFEYGVAGFGFLSLAVIWPVEAHKDSTCSSAVRILQGAVECILRLRFPQKPEYTQRHIQYAALHYLPCGAGLHLQEVQSA